MENVFWKEVDKALLERGQRRPWLATQTGISLGRINNWYVRETLPRVDDAVQIARALGVNVHQLVTGQTILTLGTLPNHMQELMRRFAGMGERDRERLLVVCRAVLGLMEQGVLDMPLDAYFRLTRQGKGKPSGFPPPDESDQGEYTSG